MIKTAEVHKRLLQTTDLVMVTVPFLATLVSVKPCVSVDISQSQRYFNHEENIPGCYP